MNVKDVIINMSRALGHEKTFVMRSLATSSAYFTFQSSIMLSIILADLFIIIVIIIYLR